MIRATIAAIALSVAYWIVFVIRIGPVVVILSPSHGVHSGDSFAFPFVAVALAMAYPWRRSTVTAPR